MCWYFESLPLQDDCSWPPTVHASMEMWPSTVTSSTWAAKAALLGHLDDQCRCMKNIDIWKVKMDVTATKLAFLSAEIPKVPSRVWNSLKGTRSATFAPQASRSSGKWKTCFLWGSVSFSAANSFVQIPACFEGRKHVWDNGVSLARSYSHRCHSLWRNSVGPNVFRRSCFQNMPFSFDKLFRHLFCNCSNCLTKSWLFE